MPDATSELDIHQVRAGLSGRTVGRRLIYRPSLTTTMALAREEAESGAPDGTAVLADEQTAGRGRLGRSWVSPPGASIYASIVFRPPASHLRALTLACPLAVCRTIEELGRLSPRIKWPNDVLIGGRKVSGTLIESEFDGDELRYAIAGVGINVNLDVSRFDEIRDIATSLSTELGHDVPREPLLAAFLNHLDDAYRELGSRALFDEWKKRLDTLGRAVRVRFGPEGRDVVEGLAENVDGDGSLIVRRADGAAVAIEAGDVTLRE